MNKLFAAETKATNAWIAALGTPGEAAALRAMRAAQLAVMAEEEDAYPEAPLTGKALLDYEADLAIESYERRHSEVGRPV